MVRRIRHQCCILEGRTRSMATHASIRRNITVTRCTHGPSRETDITGAVTLIAGGARRVINVQTSPAGVDRRLRGFQYH